jgi:sugar/nucleoside kinase (ribokinase family)
MYINDYYRSKLGIEPQIITSYGPDFEQYAKLAKLIPDKPQQSGTFIYRNIVTSDLRTRYVEHTAYAIPPQLTPKAIQALAQADVVIFGLLLPNYPAEYIRQVVKHLKPDCLKGLIAQGYLGHVGIDSKVTPRDFPEAAEVLPLMDVTVYSNDDHPRAIDMAQNWCRLPGVKSIVLTQGPKGASIFTSSKRQHVPTKPVNEVEIIDSVGCGDIFFGSLMYEYYRSHDLAKAVAQANAAARKKLLTIPTEAEAE